MGSHTDYNLGYVLTLPIGYDTWIAARPRQDRTVRLHSMNLDPGSSFSLDDIVADPEARWSNYVRGVAQVLQAEGLPLTGFEGVVHSTVPMSSGLSSSAALECVTATVFEELGGWKLEPVRKALLCQRAENEFVGVYCGILDQYTSCAGQEGCALLLDCRDLSNKPVKLADGISVVLVRSRVLLLRDWIPARQNPNVFAQGAGSEQAEHFRESELALVLDRAGLHPEDSAT